MRRLLLFRRKQLGMLYRYIFNECVNHHRVAKLKLHLTGLAEENSNIWLNGSSEQAKQVCV